VDAVKKFLAIAQSRWFIGCGLIVLALLVTADWRQVQQTRSIQARISGLTDQANSLQQKNQDLLSTLSTLKSAGAAEEQARQQLNLKQPGEFVYSFAPQQAQVANPFGVPVSISGSGSSSGDSQDAPNPQKWYNYFFRAGS
jgi:cell division protein FtsB